MDSQIREELLKNPMVIDEIKRHRWFESEKADRDIGYDAAAEDWLKGYSKAWMEYHMPKLGKGKKAAATTVSKKTRRAKSYI